MELISYLGKKVNVNLVNGFYYSGSVIDATENDITLIDKTGKKVSLSRDAILSMRELE